MDIFDDMGTEIIEAEARLFEDRDAVPSFFTTYGFEYDENAHIYRIRKPLPGIDDFEALIEITETGQAFGRIFDISFDNDDEYLLFRVMSSRGEFVEEVRATYIELLKDIRMACSVEQGFMLDPIKDAKPYESSNVLPVTTTKPKRRKTSTKKKDDNAADNVWLMFVKEKNSFAFEIDHVTCPIPLGIECNVGDIVYIYIGAPTNAIMYKCIVESADIGIMDLSVAESYTSRRFPKAFLARYGVKSVRGVSPMPKLLYDNISKS